MSNSELARRMMKVVLKRVGGSHELGRARAYIAALSPEGAAQIKAEALAE